MLTTDERGTERLKVLPGAPGCWRCDGWQAWPLGSIHCPDYGCSTAWPPCGADDAAASPNCCGRCAGRGAGADDAACTLADRAANAGMLDLSSRSNLTRPPITCSGASQTEPHRNPGDGKNRAS
jgi:hypothetical protein